MGHNPSFPVEDPLFNVAPSLKQALFPKLDTFTHEKALLACFEALCFLYNATTKPQTDPFATSFEAAVGHMADTCGSIARDVNLYKVNFSRESWPMIIFKQDDTTPLLIYYKDSTPYLYNPVLGQNTRFSARSLNPYQPMGILLYKKLPPHPQTIRHIAQLSYETTQGDLKRFVALQGIIALFMLLQPYLSGIIFDDVIKLRQYSLVDQVFLGLVVASLGVTGLKMVQNYAMVRFQMKSSGFLVSGLWNKVFSFPVRFFRLLRLGDLHERLVAIDHVQYKLTTSSMAGLCQGFFAVLILLFITLYMPLLGGMAALVTLLFVALNLLFMRRIIYHHRLVMQRQARLLSFLYESIRSIIKIKTSRIQHYVFHRWLNMELSKIRHLIKAYYLSTYAHIVEFVLPIVLTNALYFLMIQHTATGQLTPTMSLGKFIMVQMALGQYFSALVEMMQVVGQFLHLVPQIERTHIILEQKPEQQGEHHIQSILKGKICFQNVSFRYDPDGPMVLDTINLTIHPGEWVAIAGPSGAGKSTLLKLILGLETCTDGVILLDDIPLQQLDLPTVRRQIATVLQQTQLLPGSIADNLRATNPNITEDNMLSILKLVALHDDVMNMPMGLHTIITGDGRTFSMGQRQRLVLARCLAKPFSFCLLDEATSSLDNLSQDIILNTLSQIPITRLMIAHRPSTIRRANRFITLEHGRVVNS